MPEVELIYYVAQSRDGFIAGPNGELDWLHAVESPGEDYGYAGFLAGIDGLVMGRVTCEVARSFGPWPYAERPAWVLTRRVAFDRGGLPDVVQVGAFTPHHVLNAAASMKLRRLWLVGGGELAAQFAAQGLLDELVLSTVPCRLGQGIGLFGDSPQMLGHFVPGGAPRVWPNGLTQQRYRARR
jgi:dihydrofolate reductase